jgi:hypothetical protein
MRFGIEASVKLRPILLCIALALCSVSAEGGAVWYQKRIPWRYGSQGDAWETSVASLDGKHHYRLALIPLWAVEGGIVAMEILLASPERPNENLLGPEDNDPHPFVITVSELQRGIGRSRFGATRVFTLESVTLRVDIKGAHLGNGLGSASTYCRSCKNLQGFTADFSFEDK